MGAGINRIEHYLVIKNEISITLQPSEKYLEFTDMEIKGTNQDLGTQKTKIYSKKQGTSKMNSRISNQYISTYR